jgi:hypothetical protein
MLAATDTQMLLPAVTETAVAVVAEQGKLAQTLLKTPEEKAVTGHKLA